MGEMLKMWTVERNIRERGPLSYMSPARGLFPHPVSQVHEQARANLARAFCWAFHSNGTQKKKMSFSEMS